MIIIIIHTVIVYLKPLISHFPIMKHYNNQNWRNPLQNNVVIKNNLLQHIIPPFFINHHHHYYSPFHTSYTFFFSTFVYALFFYIIMYLSIFISLLLWFK
ncbi:uncharacterized protein BX664DRAFT_335388 [Halteromyces radiatus]|uniref:uncharacterized protein n=1 Tax=Halteromyces radiatus TaxID=101107 RepID=UPI00221E5587|nr:uncharacterized protein BX664DRAFT_335388 [Halteromyces radiatus]KAI8086272.1 hypothetical protein BX664DRAFT_335388 [Halteromyces radiatus]